MLFVGLKWINTQLVSVLPLIDLRSEDKGSLGHLVHSLCPYLFYDTKITFLNRLLNASAHRPEGHAPREVKLNPLEVIESKSCGCGCGCVCVCVGGWVGGCGGCWYT